MPLFFLFSGLSLKYTKMKRTKSKMNFARIKDIAVRGHGRLDNLTLARSAHMDQFYAAANWLVKHQDDRGGWPIMVSRRQDLDVVFLSLINTHTPFVQQSWSELTMPLSRHCVGTYVEVSSDAICQGTLRHSHLSSLSHHALILA